MLTLEKLELSPEEFNAVYALLDGRGKNATLSKETLGKLLRDHSAIHAELKL